MSKEINRLNLEFYEKIGDSFDTTRQTAWDGWKKLWEKLEILEEITKNLDLQVLDFGCGNARFSSFLWQKLQKNQLKESLNSQKLNYIGLDFSQILLKKAKERLEKMTFINSFLVHFDLLNFELKKLLELLNCKKTKTEFKEIFWQSLDFNFKLKNNQKLICLFGVMHHLSDLQIRQNLFDNIFKLMGNKDIFVFTTWNFRDDLRINKKLIRQFEGINLEGNDYFLNWKENNKVWRFCHFYEEKEVLELLKNSGFRLLEKFLADGKSGNLNTYWIVNKK
jgi:tRNA (uracil-5-)-methyltransferase TRM9